MAESKNNNNYMINIKKIIFLIIFLEISMKNLRVNEYS